MQSELFDAEEAAVSIPGLHYEPEFLTPGEETCLLDVIRSMPLRAAKYKEYTARRRVLSFGGSYEFNLNKLEPGIPLDGRLLPLRKRVAEWMGMPSGALTHVLVAEYAPGTPLGWHRDVPDFEVIAGVSLGDAAMLRFRPYPPTNENTHTATQLEVAPRSIYKIDGEARWGWQHCIPPGNGRRWSITFRTARR